MAISHLVMCIDIVSLAWLPTLSSILELISLEWLSWL